MADLLVDTDVLVDHLRGAAALEPRRHRVSYSILTRAELFAGPRDHEPAVATLLAPLSEVPLSRTVAERAGRLRRESALGLGDAVIAATAIQHGLRLWTRNRRHFEGIPGLRLWSR